MQEEEDAQIIILLKDISLNYFQIATKLQSWFDKLDPTDTQIWNKY